MEHSYSTSLPTLFFTPHAWSKLQTFLHISKLEVSGFGRVVPYRDDYLVDEIYLLEQEVTPASTEMAAEQIGLFAAQLAEDGVDLSQLKLWWHSHVNMGLFWSLTDNNTMRDLTSDFFFGLVGLRSGEVKVRLNVANPQLVLDDLPTKVNYDLEPEFDQWAQEYEAKVKVRVPVVVEDLTEESVVEPSDQPVTLMPAKRGKVRGRRNQSVLVVSNGVVQTNHSLRGSNGNDPEFVVMSDRYENWVPQ